MVAAVVLMLLLMTHFRGAAWRIQYTVISTSCQVPNDGGLFSPNNSNSKGKSRGNKGDAIQSKWEVRGT